MIFLPGKTEEDNYRLLGLRPDASFQEVKEAHRVWADIWHPDQFRTATPCVRENARQKYRAVNQAYRAIRDRLHEAERERLRRDREKKAGSLAPPATSGDTLGLGPALRKLLPMRTSS